MSDQRDHDGSTNPGPVGFNAYADDTPRGRPSPGGLEPQTAPDREPRVRRKTPRLMVAAGVLVALVGGLAGFLARGSLEAPAPGRPQPVDRPLADAGPARTVPVEVVAQPPPPISAPTTLLEVLPKGSVVRAQPAVPARGPPLPVTRGTRAEPDSARVGDTVTTSANATAAPRPAPQCYGSRAEQMVCGDAELRRADERLQLAYADAIEAGVPARFLRDEQGDWLAIREDAAVHSRDALASVYRQRIQELREMARRGGPDADESADPDDPGREP